MYQVVQVLARVLISASKNQTVYFRDCFDLYNSFFLGGQGCWYGLCFGIFDIYIEILDICPKTILGCLKKKQKKQKKN